MQLVDNIEQIPIELPLFLEVLHHLSDPNLLITGKDKCDRSWYLAAEIGDGKWRGWGEGGKTPKNWEVSETPNWST